MRKFFFISIIYIFFFSFPTFSKEPKTLYLICNGITQEHKPTGKKREETKTFILGKNKSFGFLKYYLISEIGKVEDCRENVKEIGCGELPRGDLSYYSFDLDRINGSVKEFIYYSETGSLSGESTSCKGKCEIKNKKFL